MSGVHGFTSFSLSYLPRARILAATLKERHPDWVLWALIVDEPPPGLDLAGATADFDRVLYARELDLFRFRAWLFKHDVVEACTAVKGAMLLRLLRAGAGKVVYLDPDIAVFGALDEVLARLDEASIVLTPHQVVPNRAAGAIRDNERAALQYGVFNLGFLAVGHDATGHAFAEWWASQLHAACYDELENGLFTDQKWCDLVPALFDRVHVARDPGLNVASWNLSTRRLAIGRDGDIRVNGAPLKFYHFTKVDAAGEVMTEKYAGDNVEVYEVWNWYKRRLAAGAVAGIPAGYWRYATFDDGTPIPRAARRLFRGRADLCRRFDDPFATGEGSFHAWLRTVEPGLLTPA